MAWVKHGENSNKTGFTIDGRAEIWTLKISQKNYMGLLRGLTHGQKFIIWMIIPVKNNSNDEF